MARLFSLLSLIILAVVGLAFAVLNKHVVVFDYFWGKGDFQLAQLLILSMALGAVLGIFFSAGIFIRLKREAIRYKRQAKLAEQEVSNLRSIPIKNER